MAKHYQLLIDNGYRYIGNGCVAKFFTNSNNKEVSVIINSVDSTIAIYNGLNTECIDRKRYSNKLDEENFINVINAKIKFYVE